jgi:hypothetical protein
VTTTTPLAGGAASDADVRAGALAEEFADKAIWELMYFGHAR